MIPRILQGKLLKAAKTMPILAVIGPRQSGKTTLVKHAFPKKKYISLENFDVRQAAEQDPRGFLNSYPQGAILDEVQKVPSIFSYLQSIVDEKDEAGQFILTGSQHFLLHEKISQSLAGRAAFFTLLPLSFDELQNYRHPFSSLEEAVFQGFYPRLYAHKIQPAQWYPDYIQTYVERDVRTLKNITDLSLFQKFLKLCAGRTGQFLNLSSLAADCGITHNTAKSWLSVLQASFIIFLLQPHFKNFRKRLVKMPKLYFYDTGVACSLLGIENKEQLKTYPLRGNLFENLIIAEFMKYRMHRGLKPNYFFWRDKAGHEIDCLLEYAKKTVVVEIKSGTTVPKEYFDNINYWNKLSGGQSKDSFVIYGGEENRHQNFGNLAGWKNMLDIMNQASVDI
ncbi:ATP-binding protein [Candidatus Peregrinibacteria bacterium]|nr:ATP-binding protein [Candidatus Peregrinibacteria bacterium]